MSDYVEHCSKLRYVAIRLNSCLESMRCNYYVLDLICRLAVIYSAFLFVSVTQILTDNAVVEQYFCCNFYLKFQWEMRIICFGNKTICGRHIQ
jgi:hypothetical protein